ncbi:hypothetical protein KSX_87630 [Ktedonospora formicarum]|uniref:DUF308 domain-containing protein n=2 Tax=Ktedonospora formicarum TaxID=2778364 RepID=A0A8J3MZA8_9CHLR|nr:hypothetical protein KSX_87630 [Ktedonospora formicarum]
MIMGLLLLFSPGMTLLVLVQLLGVYWMVTGVLAFVNLCMDRRLWGWKLITGIAGIAAGLVILRNPLWSAIFVPKVLVIFLAIDALILGVAQIIHAANGKDSSLGILGILNINFGIILLLSPLFGVFALSMLVGIIAVIGGGIASFRAFGSRPQRTPVQPPGAHPM